MAPEPEAAEPVDNKPEAERDGSKYARPVPEAAGAQDDGNAAEAVRDDGGAAAEAEDRTPTEPASFAPAAGTPPRTTR